MRIPRDDPAYPAALLRLPDPPAALTTSGPLDLSGKRVAIVGSRTPLAESAAFAAALADGLARQGVTIVSGGALGVDSAAHRAALEADGVTWVVCPTGRSHVYPPENAALFDEVAASARSRVLWPFPDDAQLTKGTPRARNGVIAALVDAMVVVQAHIKSGSRNAAAWARSLGCPLFVVPHAPWVAQYRGSLLELTRPPCQVLDSTARLEASLGLRGPRASGSGALSLTAELFPRAPSPRPARNRRCRAVPQEGWTQEEKTVFSAVSTTAEHLDRIVERCGLDVGTAVTALLTLALKDVVVEGPDGFFRLKAGR